jgi:plastocyanin
MPFTWQITITKRSDGTLEYDPNPLDSVSVGDEIIWTNDDDKPHWPAAENDPAYYMANQIAPHSPSTTFVPSDPASGTFPYTLAYSDALTPGDTGGTINVVS